ncbi:MAG: protein phosphatase 2C domain-containing protein [Planctomycetota bacterium]|nr:protein phosphatase 2C domain-containing protein [Planctomycetota bacterium]
MTIDSNAAPRLRVIWAGRSVVGCVRTNNEDALWAGALAGDPGDGREITDDVEGDSVLLRPGAVLAVADGMGGAKAGEVASELAVTILREEMLRRAAEGAADGADEGGLAEAFVGAVEVANERIRDESAVNPARRGMGTTLTAVWVYDHTAQLVHVGDSRAYLFRKGRLSRLTKDQSLVEKLLEDNIITEEEAQRMGARNIILQALGSEEDLDVAQPRSGLEAGDILMLCTDGLTGVVPDDDVEEILRAGGSLEEACARLIAAAEAGGGPDNITVLVGRIEPEHSAPHA